MKLRKEIEHYLSITSDSKYTQSFEIMKIIREYFDDLLIEEMRTDKEK